MSKSRGTFQKEEGELARTFQDIIMFLAAAGSLLFLPVLGFYSWQIVVMKEAKLRAEREAQSLGYSSPDE